MRRSWSSVLIPRSREARVKFAIFIILIISVLDLIGWIFNIPLFKNFDVHWTSMRIITAVSLIFYAVALLLIQERPANPFSIIFARVTGTFIIVVSSLTILVSVKAVNSGAESSLANTPFLNLFLAYDSRMALMTALIFLFLGTVLLFLAGGSQNGAKIAHVLIIPAAVMSYFVPVVYLLDVTDFFKVNQIFAAPNTGYALIMLCLAVLLMRPGTWLMKVFTGKNTGSVMARMLLPGFLIFPVVIGWLRIYGEQNEYFKSEVGSLLVAMTYTVCLFLLVWLSAWSVNSIDERRRKSEEAVRESEEKFRVLANTIPQLAWMANADGYIFWYNERWYDYTGTTPEEMEGWGWQRVHDPEMLPDVMEKWKASLATQKPFEMVFPLLGKDGKYRSFLTRGLPLFNEEGELMQWFGTNTDVSVIQETENKLKDAQDKLNLALENANIGIWERDLKTNRSIWDKRTEKMFGFSEGTFDGTPHAFEKCLVEEDVPHVREAIRKAIEENVPYESVCRVRLTNGNINYITSKGLVTRDDEGKAIRLAGVCFDITDMKNGAEQAIFKLNDELLRSNKELAQFAYLTSHDLQEPLRTISTYTQTLAQRYKDKFDGQGQQFIHYIVESSLRMTTLLHDLLTYSRIGTNPLTYSDVDFNKVFSKVIHKYRLAIQEKNAEVTFDELPSVIGDEGQLVQLLQDLVWNAIKFCDTTPKVHVSAKEEPYRYLFSVKDNGIGIEPQYADRIFLIFQRLAHRHEYGGTGIGLAVCKRIVERHGGKIWFKSQPGEGTTFYFTIAKYISTSESESLETLKP